MEITQAKISQHVYINSNSPSLHFLEDEQALAILVGENDLQFDDPITAAGFPSGEKNRWKSIKWNTYILQTINRSSFPNRDCFWWGKNSKLFIELLWTQYVPTWSFSYGKSFWNNFEFRENVRYLFSDCLAIRVCACALWLWNCGPRTLHPLPMGFDFAVYFHFFRSKALLRTLRKKYNIIDVSSYAGVHYRRFFERMTRIYIKNLIKHFWGYAQKICNLNALERFRFNTEIPLWNDESVLIVRSLTYAVRSH